MCASEAHVSPRQQIGVTAIDIPGELELLSPRAGDVAASGASVMTRIPVRQLAGGFEQIPVGRWGVLSSRSACASILRNWPIRDTLWICRHLSKSQLQTSFLVVV